jgi:hypothetical protein
MKNYGKKYQSYFMGLVFVFSIVPSFSILSRHYVDPDSSLIAAIDNNESLDVIMSKITPDSIWERCYDSERYYDPRYTDLSKGSPGSRTPLTTAVGLRRKDVVQALLHAGANVDADGFFGETALMSCAQRGDIQIAELLLDAKADVNARDRAGDTSLHYAIWECRVEMVRLLLDAGAKIYARSFVTSTGRGGQNSLEIAIEIGSEAIVRILLDAGFDIEVENALGETPLVLYLKDCCRDERLYYTAIAEMLIEAGDDVEYAVSQVSVPSHCVDCLRAIAEHVKKKNHY